jgi:hypothetical protein
MVPTVTGQNAPTTKTPPTKRTHFFSKINHYQQIIFVIQMFINIFPRFVFVRIFGFLFYYIFINLFIKIINLIHDDCVQICLE